MVHDAAADAARIVASESVQSSLQRMEQIIVEGEMRISRLHLLVAGRASEGHDTYELEAMLRRFEEMLGSWNRYRLRVAAASLNMGSSHGAEW